MQLRILFTCFVISGLFSPTFSIAQATCAYVYDEYARGTFDAAFKWEKPFVTVGFVNGNTYLHDKVKQYASEWCKYANIQFLFLNDQDADIRIGFYSGMGSWSLLGNKSATNSIDIETQQSFSGRGGISMNFGWFDEHTSEKEFRRTILHEFGHALSLEHEHNNPESGIIWNKSALYRYYWKSQAWTPEQVDHNILRTYSENKTNGQYDQFSIMHYPISAEHTLNGKSVDWNDELSPGDITLISQLYPKSPPTTTPSSKGYAQLTCITYGSAGWTMALSTTDDKAEERWFSTTTFPDPSVLNKWSENYQISQLCFGFNHWVVGLKKRNHKIQQICLESRDFPNDKIMAYAHEGYTIDCLTYGQEKWILIMSKSESNSSQVVQSSNYFPNETIEKQWKSEFFIRSLDFFNGQWCLRMDKNTPFAAQTYFLQTEFPAASIQEQLSKGFAITNLSYGDGKWLVVLSSGAGIKEQSVITRSYFPEAEIQKKLQR